jgi:phosphoglucosamine mutase
MLKLGWACGRVFSGKGEASQRPVVVIGKDTRVSGYMFESALEAGLVAAGVDVRLLGPMPTPAVAMMTKTLRATAGIVISASHNPYYDNGIKFFTASGAKLDDTVELAIEAALDEPLVTAESRAIGKVLRIVDAAGRYIEFCKASVPAEFSLRGLKVAVDCANGATYHIAPNVLAELGAEVFTLGVQPDGFNINEKVGSTDTTALSKMVVERGADVGIAYDGDGDRVLFVDHEGVLVDGDELLFIIAMHRLARGEGMAGVVGTQMSNLGLELALREAGLEFVRAKVGDRYVRELMDLHRWNLGGESSGHIICADLATTGDGIVSSLQVLRALVAAEQPLAQLRKQMRKLPQTMLNVRGVCKESLQSHPGVAAAVLSVEQRLGTQGRVLLRPSGTEPVVRVMVEGEDAGLVAELCRSLADDVLRLVAKSA